MYRVLVAASAFILFAATGSNVRAAPHISFTTSVNELLQDEPITLTASVSGFADSEEIYIKGVFVKPNGTNYFGLNQFGDHWIKNSANTNQQRKVLIGTWDRQVYLRPDPEDTGFTDSGMYTIKLGYYRIKPNGEISPVSWAESEYTINLIKQLPSSTPTVYHSPKPSPTIRSASSGISPPISPATMIVSPMHSIKQLKTIQPSISVQQSSTIAGIWDSFTDDSSKTSKLSVSAAAVPFLSRLYAVRLLAMLSVLAASGSMYSIWKHFSR